MSARRRRLKRGSGNGFIMLPHYLVKCEAWRTMPPNGKAVLLHLWERHNGSNNGEIVYAVRDAQAIGIGKSNAALALAWCVERGFLQAKRDSAFNVKMKKARTWILTAEPVNGRPATKEFMRWSVPSQTRWSRPAFGELPRSTCVGWPSRGLVIVRAPTTADPASLIA